jgi:tRNA U55 pseudouridine synthase TruB
MVTNKVQFTVKDNVIRSWKPKSQSPNEHLDLIKKELGYTGKSCYAGRLDPMASGEMIYLINEKTKECKKYIGHNKTYAFDIVCGFSTDSLDCMGMVQETNLDYNTGLYDLMKGNIESGKYLKYIQTMPSCSSYKAKSKQSGEKKPLWEWKLLDRLDEVDIPKKNVELKSFEIVSQDISTVDNYIKSICEDINRVSSFPRTQLQPIIDQWKEINKNTNGKNIRLIRCSVTVPSGMFVRYLANMIGNDVGIPCHAFDITRNEIFL